MTIHINGIVQSTRRLLAIEEHMALLGPRDEGRADLEAKWQTESNGRQGLVLAAIRAGVDDDLMRWAIGVQEPEHRLATQFVIDALRTAAVSEHHI